MEEIPVSISVVAAKKATGAYVTDNSLTLDKSLPGMTESTFYYAGSKPLGEDITLSAAKITTMHPQ